MLSQELRVLITGILSLRHFCVYVHCVYVHCIYVHCVYVHCVYVQRT